MKINNIKDSLDKSCNVCNSPMNWFIKIMVLIIMLFILTSSLYYYYINVNPIIIKDDKLKVT